MAKNVLQEKAKTFFFHCPTLRKDTFVPPFDYLVMIIKVCGII